MINTNRVGLPGIECVKRIGSVMLDLFVLASGVSF